MPNFNRVTLVGNLVHDPDIRYVAGGTPVVKFSIAINRRLKGGKSAVDYFDIIVWGKRAETCNAYLKKGAAVLVDGALRNRTYETNDGDRRTAIEIVASDVRFLTSKANDFEGMGADAGGADDIAA